MWYGSQRYHHWYRSAETACDVPVARRPAPASSTRATSRTAARSVAAASARRARYRFTTYERPEGARLIVVKRDGSREEFDREKLRAGLLKALQKRPVTLDRVEAAARRDRGRACAARGDAEVPSTEIGRLATEALRDLDQLAYIRFASVYHAYDDIETLQREVDRLIRGAHRVRGE